MQAAAQDMLWVSQVPGRLRKVYQPISRLLHFVLFLVADLLPRLLCVDRCCQW
jgi:hypothetical protein